MIGLVQSAGQARADRYTYIPLIGIFIAVVWALADVRIARVRRTLPVLGGLVLAGCTVLTYRQAATWKNTETLARHAIATNADNSFAHSLLGVEMMSRDDFDGAIAELRAALALAPGAEDESNLGIAFVRKGDPAVALPHLQRAVSLAPENAEAGYNLGHALMLLERYEEAIPELTKTSSGAAIMVTRTTTLLLH